MSHLENLSQNPYFDDFNPEKGYYRILFRPGKAVQGRELTQIQTILSHQIESFAGHIFKPGSVVTGGGTTLETTGVKYIKLESSYNGNQITLTDFKDKFITDTSSLGIRAYVIAVQDETTTTPKTLIVKYTSPVEVDDITSIDIQTEDGLHTCRTYASAPVVGNASICSIDVGKFFVQGVFAHVAKQTLILDAYGTTPSYKIGLEIVEAIVDEREDSSLLDPALGSSNYQAPGATRYKLTLNLAKRSLTSTDDSLFIELLRVTDGKITKINKYPLYSDLENTLARRTYDESGNYTVKPFKVSLGSHTTYSNAYSIILESGKAYVHGYEFETIGTTELKSERARDVSNVYNYNLTVDYQNYVDVTSLKGPIQYNTLIPLTLHCVNTASINTSSAVLAAATNIGTIRIRALDYQYGANTTSINTGVWRAYLIDANVTNYTSNATGGSANTITLNANASTLDNAYSGVKLRIVKHAGVNVGEVYTISSYTGSSRVATLETGKTFSFGVPTSATEFSLDYEFKDVECIVSGNSNVITTAMDISSDSKASAAEDVYRGVYIADTNFNKAILQLPNQMIGSSSVIGGTPITNSEYLGRRLYVSQSFSANVLSLTTSSGFTSAVNGNPLSASDAIDNILVVIKNPGTGSLANNQVINFSNTSNSVVVTTGSNTSTYTITVPGAMNATADVYVKVSLPYSHTLGSLVKSKTQLLANTGNVWSVGGVTVASGITYYSQYSGANGAQINFANTALSKLQTPNQPQTLYVADGIRVAGVYDFGANNITQANLAYALDITSSYSFDSGQRDNTYDHCSIQLKPNSTGPKGNTAVYVDYFSHSGIGYITVDSYISTGISYENIPTYTSPTTGVVYNLRDCIDFRPRRVDADVVGEFSEVVLGISGTNFQTDFSYYLSRIDKVILTKDRTFEVISGIPSLNPVPPSDKENSMTLYTLTLPAYTANTKDISVKYIDNRRYTMRDIGTLEKRISNLEYYTSLNFLERAAKDQEIIDDTGLNRFKNGIIVDPFTGHSIGDVRNTDYHCAIDPKENELRPPFESTNFLLDINESNSTNYSRNGSIFTLPYTANTFIDQPFASFALNVNPFNTIAFIGNIQLDPSSDVWVDTNQAPDVLVNLEGDNDAWKIITDNILQINPGRIFGTIWNSWQTTWTGVSNEREVSTTSRVSDAYNGVFWNETVNRNLIDVTQQQSRSGLRTTFAPDTITKSIGNKVVDVSVIPYIREKGILFSGKMFLPNTSLYGYFDGTAVTNYINRVNIIEVNSNTATYIDTYQNGEVVRVYEPATSKNTAFARVVRTQNYDTKTNVSIVNLTAGDDGFIQNVAIKTANATFLIGVTSGSNTRISGYAHRSGQIANISSNTITFQHDILNSNTNSSNTNLIGQTIYITDGLGEGQSGIVQTYNVTTGQAVLTTSFTTTPNTTSYYSIGQLSSDDRGECHGVFSLPSSSSIKFRTGERVFRLIDSNTNNLASSKTNGEVKYISEGLLQTQEDTIISTRVPSIQRTSLNDERTVTSTVVTRETNSRTFAGYMDPLAQTFMVDQRVYPSGIQLTGIRFIFKSKDPIVPLNIQLRPAVNGFPHSSLPIPGSDVVVEPNDIIEVSEATLSAEYANSANPLDNSQLYTEINFKAPIYLQPGAEYAFVMLANSIKYEVYASEVGQELVGTDRLISTQPYLGSLFKSQNSTLWNPIQEQDIMFRLLRANYNISSRANLEFKIHANSLLNSNTNVDVFYITSGNMILPNTSLESLFCSTTNSGTKEVAKTFQLNENSYFEDTLGNRVITSSSDSFKVRLLLSSQNEHISPVVDKDRLSILSIKNLVNNGGLSNSSITVINSTNTYANANITVSISGGNGTGANAYAVVVANAISSIVVDAPGSGYTESPIITINGGGGSANAIVVGENQSSGGPALARYITRKVTLADGMDAGDFRVYFNAFRPKEATIDVYYKVLSSDDSDIFDSKGYQLMTIIQGYNNISLNNRDMKEFVYAPGISNVPDNQVIYGTFNSFKHFAIKVVMRTSDSTKVPRIKDFRVIAIPSLS